MKTTMLAVCTFLAALLSTAGCTYDVTAPLEVVDVPTPTVEASDAGPAPDADVDSAAPTDEDGGMQVGKGASGTKQLVRGQSTQPTTVLSEHFNVQNDDGSIDRQAGIYTVQFSLRPVSGPPPNNSTTGTTIAYAIVTWTVGGNQIKRALSVIDGATLTGTGEGCIVQVYDATVVQGVDPNPDYIITVTLTPGTRGTSANPPLFVPSVLDQFTDTSNSGSLAPGGITEVPIPAGIGVTSVMVVVTDNDPMGKVLILQQSGAIVGVTSYTATDYPSFVPVNPLATRIVIDNSSGTDFNAYAVFFGVDG